MPDKELLFSITKKDCDWQFIRGTGKGGQKRNKTSNAVRCTHRDSGAVGFADDTRSQIQNRRLAFERMAKDPVFRNWHRLETARRTGEARRIEEEANREVDRQMKAIKIEVIEDGNWKEVREDEIKASNSSS